MKKMNPHKSALSLLAILLHAGMASAAAIHDEDGGSRASNPKGVKASRKSRADLSGAIDPKNGSAKDASKAKSGEAAEAERAPIPAAELERHRTDAAAARAFARRLDPVRVRHELEVLTGEKPMPDGDSLSDRFHIFNRWRVRQYLHDRLVSFGYDVKVESSPSTYSLDSEEWRDLRRLDDGYYKQDKARHQLVNEDPIPPAKTKIRKELRDPVVNLVVEIAGTDPASVIEVNAHYDSAELRVPGADDNGTGLVTALELARLYKEKGVQPEKTLRFIFADLEERDSRGTKLHLEKLKQSRATIAGAFVVDMIGWTPVAKKGTMPYVVEVGTASKTGKGYAKAKELANLLVDQRQSFPASRPVTLDLETRGASPGTADHGPYWDAGLPALLIAAPYDDDSVNPENHERRRFGAAHKGKATLLDAGDSIAKMRWDYFEAVLGDVAEGIARAAGTRVSGPGTPAALQQLRAEFTGDARKLGDDHVAAAEKKATPAYTPSSGSSYSYSYSSSSSYYDRDYSPYRSSSSPAGSSDSRGSSGYYPSSDRSSGSSPRASSGGSSAAPDLARDDEMYRSSAKISNSDLVRPIVGEGGVVYAWGSVPPARFDMKNHAARLDRQGRFKSYLGTSLEVLADADGGNVAIRLGDTLFSDGKDGLEIKAYRPEAELKDGRRGIVFGLRRQEIDDAIAKFRRAAFGEASESERVASKSAKVLRPVRSLDGWVEVFDEMGFGTNKKAVQALFRSEGFDLAGLVERYQRSINDYGYLAEVNPPAEAETAVSPVEKPAKKTLADLLPRLFRDDLRIHFPGGSGSIDSMARALLNGNAGGERPDLLVTYGDRGEPD